MKYFEVLRNKFKTYKNPDENPDLPMDCHKEIYVFLGKKSIGET
jgi:hypothetical protein